MSFSNMLGPTAWVVLLSLPPLIVLLYFLKLKRQPLEVPSTLLWRRAIEDLHVNSLWQKLRRSLLLFLQLLLLALLMLALLRPGWAGFELSGNRFVFLIDVSGSMQATDQGSPRIESAKERVEELIRQMEPGDEAMIIAFASRPTIVQSYTSNRNELLDKLDDIKVTNETSDLRNALVAAAGLANPGRANPGGVNDVPVADPKPAELFIISDGGFDTVRNFSLGNLEPNYIPIGRASDIRNVAVTSFEVVEHPEQPGQLQAFARIENFGDDDAEVEVELFSGDTSIDFDRIRLAAGASQGIPFDLRELEASDAEQKTFRFELHFDDQLSVDNVAYAVTNPPRRSNVLVVSDYPEPFQLVFGTTSARKLAAVTYQQPAYLSTQEFRRAAEESAYDLALFDRCRPEVMPMCNTLFLGQLPRQESWHSNPDSSSPVIIDVDQTHPLTELVELRHLLVLSAFSLEPPPGSHHIIEANVGCLLAISARQGFEDAVLGFPLVTPSETGELEPNTDWPRLRSFPIFMHNVLRYLGGSHMFQSMPNTLPGDSAQLYANAAVQSIEVSAPNGTPKRMERSGNNNFSYNHTADVGVYDVRHGFADVPSQRFAVNMFSRQESDIRVRDVTIGYRDVEPQTERISARFELWKWLLLGALGVVVFEWYVFNKRTYL